ncbi:MAG: ATP-binding protein [Chryseolinea sp.]
MNIRTRLTLIFFSIVTVVLTVMAISTYYFSSQFRKQDFVQRLKNRAINVARVLTQVEEVDADLLKRMERNNPASLTNQYIVVFNYRNEELYRSEGTRTILVDAVMLSRIRNTSEVRFVADDYEGIGFLYNADSDRFIIVATATDVTGFEALANLRDILLTTLGVCIVIVSFLGWFYAGRVLRPISRIISEVSNISESNLSLRLEKGNQNDELGKLALTFNKMLSRLEGAFLSQRTFIANASHEIKTPITAMSGQVEVALLQERDKTYYLDLLQKIMSGLKGLNKLSGRLLLLAQSTNDQSRENFEAVRVDDILWSAKDELLKAQPNYYVDVRFDLNLQDNLLSIQGDEQLLRAAILNLLENGCKYSTDNTVKVELMVENQGFLTITFLNNGQAIPIENLSRIFDPFYRSGAQAFSKKGFGVGLSIVRSVVSLHSGSISVASDQDKNLFIVNLPI